MIKTENLDNDFKTWVIFHQAALVTNKVSEAEFFKYGISRVQAGIIYVIKNSDEPLSPSQISRIFIQEPHSTAELLNRMQKHGIIKKTVDPSRKNIKRVALTDKGEDIYKKLITIETTSKKLLSCLSPEEKTALFTCSKKLVDEALKCIPAKRPWQPLFWPDLPSS